MESSLKAMTLALKSFCKGDAKTLKTNVDQCIKDEKKQDDVREKIISKMFGKDSMVFSRSDRIKLVYQMNKIVSHGESVARRLLIHNVKPNTKLTKGLLKISDDLSSIATDLKGLVISVLEDFSKGRKIVDKINDVRRNFRNNEYDLLKILYESKNELHFADFVYLEDLLTNTAKVANEADKIADDIYSLIVKYTL